MSLPASAYESLASLLKSRSGLVLGADKSYLLEAKLAPIARREGLRDVAGLAEILRRPGNETLIAEVVESMTTNESLFFRDEKPFAHLRTVLLPAIAASTPRGRTLRIWSAAASTGQEPYSIAMTIAESKLLLGERRVEIVATDLAREPLNRTREGIYSQFEIQRGLPMAMLARYFQKEPAGWRIRDTLRAMVQCREWNLLADPAALGTFDIIFCRNVLIYFDPPTKTRVLESIARQLAPHGALYLGGAETIFGVTERLVPWPDTRGIYRLPQTPH